jgi:outer membrane protein, heavy metal efflux system
MSASRMNTAFQAMSKLYALKNTSKSIVSCLVAATLFTGCAKEIYQAKPISLQQTSAKIFAKDPLSEEFKVYLIKQGYTENQLPFTEWGLNELTLCALYFNSKLDVAKTQLALANATVNTANQQTSYTLGGRVAHSNQANGDKNPWAFGLEVEIPIETANKREIKVEEAQHLAEMARIDVADVAWQLRSQIARDLLRYHENIARQKLLLEEVNKQAEIVRMAEKRVNLGAMSNTEVSVMKLQAQNARAKLDAEQAKSAEIHAALTADVGLTTEKFNQLTLKSLNVENTLAQQNAQLTASENLQESTLLNRLDIRRSLEKYAAAESKIKLEVAKQTSDISLSPGIAFEFGDSIWSLGFSTLLNLLNKNNSLNQSLIAEATQLREVEGAQFETLQSKIIGDLSQSLAVYQASLQSTEQIKAQQTAQLQVSQKLQKQFDAGLIDRLELTQNTLNAGQLSQQLLSAQYNNLNAALALEDMMQHPIFDEFSINTEK